MSKNKPWLTHRRAVYEGPRHHQLGAFCPRVLVRRLLLRGERVEVGRPCPDDGPQRAAEVLRRLRLQQEAGRPPVEAASRQGRRKTRDMGLPRHFRLQARRKVNAIDHPVETVKKGQIYYTGRRILYPSEVCCKFARKDYSFMTSNF